MTEKSLITKQQKILEYLLKMDCSEYTKRSPANNANYLSWSYAWQEFKKVYPFAYVTLTKNDRGTYELEDSFGTFFVEVTVHNGGEKTNGEQIEESHTVALPIMDNKHKPMRKILYKYTTKFGTKEVKAATSFDTNYAIQRAKTKAISDFGLGLYIYHGETIPDQDNDFVGAVEKKAEVTPEKAQNIFWDYLLNLDLPEKTRTAIYNKLNPNEYIKNRELNEDWKGHIKEMTQGFCEGLAAQLLDAKIDITGQTDFKTVYEEFNYLVNLKKQNAEK